MAKLLSDQLKPGKEKMIQLDCEAIFCLLCNETRFHQPLTKDLKDQMRILPEYITTVYKCKIKGLPRRGFLKGKNRDNVGSRPETKHQLRENKIFNISWLYVQ